jgi:hypothetical protein
MYCDAIGAAAMSGKGEQAGSEVGTMEEPPAEVAAATPAA